MPSATPENVTQQLIRSHRVHDPSSGEDELALRIDQTLTQDATGTLVMLELEALGIDRVRTEHSAQYVDHNLIQADFRNPDDHIFLHSACERFGVWFSRPGNGVSHPLHMQSFGRPGASLLGSDSHTCAAGALGMLAIGAGGLDVAMAMAGEPFYVEPPEVWGVRLQGSLPSWVSAKDVILELLRRHGVAGGVGRIIEYHGPGVFALDAWDRHVIANMGAELGATTTVFPSDERTREFLRAHGREGEWLPLAAEQGARYDVEETIVLDELEPLIAAPSSPGNVVPVREVAGKSIYQAYIGSSANPAYRDFAVVAEIVREHRVPPDVSLDINPSTRRVLSELSQTGALDALLQAGARIHQAGCNGCIGMGQAPASGRHSVRTVPRNFPGRSGTPEDSVWLCSPETAAASALRGEITDPRSLGSSPPHIPTPSPPGDQRGVFAGPPQARSRLPLQKGPNIVSLPELEPTPDALTLTVALRMGDDVSTDEILPAGSEVLPLRSNIEAIAEFCFRPIDPGYVDRVRGQVAHCVAAGRNYGQGSSREHAALAPRFLGLRVVLAQSFARIHFQNLVSYGVLPLRLTEEEVPDTLRPGATMQVEGLHQALRDGIAPQVQVDGTSVAVANDLSARARRIVRAGGLIAYRKQMEGNATETHAPR